MWREAQEELEEADDAVCHENLYSDEFRCLPATARSGTSAWEWELEAAEEAAAQHDRDAQLYEEEQAEWYDMGFEVGYWDAYDWAHEEALNNTDRLLRGYSISEWILTPDPYVPDSLGSECREPGFQEGYLEGYDEGLEFGCEDGLEESFDYWGVDHVEWNKKQTIERKKRIAKEQLQWSLNVLVMLCIAASLPLGLMAIVVAVLK